MPTTIVTGRDITFTIAGDNYDAQATSAILTIDSTINTYQTLDGKAYYTTDSQGTFAVEMLADWPAGGSLCNALWTAADTATLDRERGFANLYIDTDTAFTPTQGQRVKLTSAMKSGVLSTYNFSRTTNSLTYTGTTGATLRIAASMVLEYIIGLFHYLRLHKTTTH